MARNSGVNTGFNCILLAVGVLRSLASECVGENCKNVISMPLMDKMKATLKADLDVTNMNNHLKAYIEQQTQKSVGTAMKDDMKQLIDNKLKEINAKIESTILEELKRIGVTYVRWGRKGCPDGAELVYTGQAGGNRYNHNGGGVNYLCLPNDPENGEHQSFVNSQLYGAEYEIFADRNPRGMSSILGNREVPCAVCRRKRRSSVITIPGRKTCYKDWNAEYNGYLMASHNNYKRTDYACIDVNAEQFDNKSAYNEDGALFYPIRTSCGSLRCPPYRKDADVLCVLCTK
ncbi:short-chain collagen C4-like isoform X3 [Mytilus californianus]|uniref:short-chain collagen C4-like isoform X3 n=1 Tax=Mytilus californianus TaxID=6549 RepID=UPI002245FCD0|nr:short-chain collagen C4-like isoform X3 [Mytilus californianus]